MEVKLQCYSNMHVIVMLIQRLGNYAGVLRMDPASALETGLDQAGSFSHCFPAPANSFCPEASFSVSLFHRCCSLDEAKCVSPCDSHAKQAGLHES